MSKKADDADYPFIFYMHRAIWEYEQNISLIDITFSDYFVDTYFNFKVF